MHKQKQKQNSARQTVIEAAIIRLWLPSCIFCIKPYSEICNICMSCTVQCKEQTPPNTMARYHPDSISIYWLMMMMMVVVTGVALVASARLHFWLQLAGIFRIGLARVRLLCNVQWLHLATFWFMYQTQTTNRPPMHEHFNVISNMLSSVSWCAWWWTATTKTAAVAAHYTHQNICSCGRLIRSRRWHHSTKHAVHAKPAHKKKYQQQPSKH